MKRIIYSVFFIFLFVSFLGISETKAQMSGIYSIGYGASDDYNTLFQALQALQSDGANGAVVFELSADYAGTAEAYPIHIQDFTGSSETNTLTIRPATGTSHILERDNAIGIFFLNNVSNVIIDGSNNGTNSHDLIISNLSEADSNACIAIENGTNITLKNCIMKGGKIDFISSGIASDGCSNLLIDNNIISRAQIGIITFGDDITITNNEIGSEKPSDYLDYGVSCQFGANLLVSNNKFFNFIDNDCHLNDNAIHAIAINDFTGDVEVSNNYIDSLIHTGTNNVVQAIAISDCNTDNLLIVNNRISNIASNSYSDKIFGAIALDSPDLTSITIAYNSINIPASSNYGIEGDDYVIVAALIINAGAGITFKNNIISNTLGRRDGATNIAFGAAIAMNFTENPFVEIDNNVYFVGGDYYMTFLAINSSPTTMELTDWQAFTGGEQNSISQEEICFKSDDSLQLNACSPAIARAEPIIEATTDIAGIDRDIILPTIGAYEYEKIQSYNLIQVLPVVKDVGWVWLEWQSGNGYRTAIFMKEGNFVDTPAIPENGVTYIANTTFGNGTEIGSSGWFCMYNELSSEYSEIYDITATNNTEYTVMACEYYGSNGNEIYNTETAVDNPIIVYASNVGAINEISNFVKIFPNPTTGIVNIDLETQIDAISIFDFTGKEVLTQSMLNSNQIDISSLNKGMYLIRVQSGNQFFGQKVILK